MSEILFDAQCKLVPRYSTMRESERVFCEMRVYEAPTMMDSWQIMEALSWLEAHRG